MSLRQWEKVQKMLRRIMVTLRSNSGRAMITSNYINTDEYPAELLPLLTGAKLYDSSCSPEARIVFIDEDGAQCSDQCSAHIKKRNEFYALEAV